MVCLFCLIGITNSCVCFPIWTDFELYKYVQVTFGCARLKMP